MGAPTGTVTFLFTDIEGSTGLWQEAPEAMPVALERHNAIVRSAVKSHGGYMFSTGGDGFGVAFARAGEAVAAAVEAQAALGAELWPEGAAIRVRMGLHTGEVTERGGDYVGTPVNQAARLMAIGHGGQVLCSAATAEVAGDGVALVDLGEHRLRDLNRPMHVFQIGGESFAPLRSLDVLPGNLPLLTSSFVGREVELSAVAKELGAARLVTVTGVGGVGKTRLALQVAAELLPTFAHGAWVCELAAAADADELAQVVALALGVVPRARMTLIESIVDFLRNRHVLIVLDNCEHLLDAGAALAEAILSGAPRVRVLATSREGLGVVGERMWPLRSLRVSSEADDAGPSEAVVLFAARAVAADPGFVLNETNLAAVVEVCRRLDGIPLAIELAAARVATMSPAEIAGHLDERFRLLAGGRRRGVERHQTLRSAIEWSYSLLAETERLVFERLGVFPAGFDEAAAVAVCATDGIEPWDVIDALASLAAKSMVGVEHRADATRYQLLETLRHFARDGADDLDGLRRRHAAHYARLAEQIGAGLTGSDELVWRPRLAAEIDNLRAATGWAFEAPTLDDTRLGAGILNSLLVYANGSPSWGIQAWAGAAMPLVETLGADDRAAVLAAAARNAHEAGDPDRVKAFGGRVISESHTASPAFLSAVGSVALACLLVGDPQAAMAVLAEGRQRLNAEGGSDYLNSGLQVITAWVAYSFGDLDTARSAAEDALASARRTGNPAALAAALASWARTRPDDRADEALACAEESLRMIEAGAGADSTYSAALMTVAVLRMARGDTAGAVRAIDTAIRYNARSGIRSALATDVAIAVLVLAGSPGGAHAAATLAGAANGPVLKGYFWLSPDHRDRYARALARTVDTLGAGPCADAQQEGAEMTYDEIIDYVLTHLDSLAQAGA